jgi:3-(3-hydroxy-phenyl)propionate hydroxylase
VNKNFDVIIVGMGPSGLVLAGLLANYGIKIGIFDRKESTVNEPRAVSIDDESLRILQSCSLHEAVIKNISQNYGSHYYDAKGKLFLKVEPNTFENGFFKRNAFDQPTFERTLRKNLESKKNININFSHTLVSLKNESNRVIANFKDSKGIKKSFLARYLVGCDGGQSTVRDLIGAVMKGSTFNQKWLVVDIYKTRNFFRHTQVYCNPKRPSITLPGPNGIRRYEFKLNHGESSEKVSEDFTRKLLASVGVDGQAKIRRSQIYQFHALISSEWKKKSVFIVGDAAHLSPPFAGQGMNSGIRDVGNLGWKLALAIKKPKSKDILETYFQERKDHCWALINLAIRMGNIMVPKNTLDSFFKASFFRLIKINKTLLSYVSQMKYRPKPKINTGLIFFHGKETRDDKKLIGTLFPQPLVQDKKGILSSLDEVLGNKFSLVCYIKNHETYSSLEKHLNNLSKTCKVVILLNQSCMIFPSRYKVVRDFNNLLENMETRVPEDSVLLIRPDKLVSAICKKNNLHYLSNLLNNNEIFSF